MTTDERSLATWLAARDDEDLALTFAQRGVSATALWHDAFDAAAALLDAASIDRALVRLPRRSLSALARHAPDARLVSFALSDPAGAPYAAVETRVRAAIARRPAAFDDDRAAPPAPAADEHESAVAAEQALTAAGALADLLLAARHAPLARTGAGAVSAADRKRLMDAGAVDSADDLDDLVQAAFGAGLLAASERDWIITVAADRWLEAGTAQRWATVAEGVARALPSGLRTAGGGYEPISAWADAYPLDADWPARAAQLQRICVRWGMATPQGGEPRWVASLRAGGPADAESLAAVLPPEIDRVYLQADLSAIAPGPLAPAFDLRLRRIAHRESRAQASTYRFSAESIVVGMTEGETAHSIREFLTSLSLTGIPQPLEYLIETTAARHGLVRVRVDPESGRTLVETANPAVRDAIAVDQGLRPLGLVRDGEVLTTRVGRDALYWALADARYPVMAVDEHGDPESPHRRPARSQPQDADPPLRVYADLIGRLRAAHETDSDAAWLSRELDQAVRSRATIQVAVRLPDGSERAFTLEATGLGGGRLRGRDRTADIERTLPVSSIVSVRPVAL